MSDYQTVTHAPYTWHPIMPSFLTLLADMKDCLKQEPEEEWLARRRAEYIEKLKGIALRIAEMRKLGMTGTAMAKSLGCGLSTLGMYNRHIKEYGIC